VHGGTLFAEIVIVAGLTVAGIWLVWIMIKAQDDLRRDATASTKSGGGRPSIGTGRRDTLTQHTHPSSHDGEASL
jgi:hypothetical protein